MSRKCFAVLIIILTSTTGPLNAGERYLCVPDQVAGFSFDQSTNRWKSVNLRSEDEKYIIDVVTSSKSALSIVSANSNHIECWSDKGFASTNEADFKCIFGEFRFNKNTGRFIRTYTSGYIDGLDNKENTPAILIGKCTPFLGE